MSALSSLAQLQAVAAGVAQPLATVRHCHVPDAPLVLVPLKLAGEAAAPLAVLVGSAPGDPTLLVVPQPRNRDLRFAFAAEIADVVLPYIDEHRATKVDGCFTDAPQMLVPNEAATRFVALFGRSTRFRRTDGQYAVAPSVPLLGRWLTFLAERAGSKGTREVAGGSHAISLSAPDAVTATILDAVAAM